MKLNFIGSKKRRFIILYSLSFFDSDFHTFCRYFVVCIFHPHSNDFENNMPFIFCEQKLNTKSQLIVFKHLRPKSQYTQYTYTSYKNLYACVFESNTTQDFDKKLFYQKLFLSKHLFSKNIFFKIAESNLQV